MYYSLRESIFRQINSTQSVLNLRISGDSLEVVGAVRVLVLRFLARMRARMGAPFGEGRALASTCTSSLYL